MYIIVFSGSIDQIDCVYYNKVAQAYAQSTTQNFISQWSKYIEFCATHRLVLYPPSTMNVARFLTIYSDKVGSYATVANMLSSIKTFYRLSGYQLNTESPIIDLLMKSCKRTMSVSAKPKSPIEVGHILLIQNLIDFSDPCQYTFFLALIIQFFACLRVSNLVPTSVNHVASKCHLKRSQVSVLQNAIILTLHWSKTLQNSQDLFTIPIAGAPGSILDPFALYVNYVKQFPVPSHCPVFSYIQQGNLCVFTRSMYTKYLKSYLARIGVNPHNYSSHSVRRGSASFMNQCQVPIGLIKLHGTWRSSAYQKYIQYDFHQKLCPTLKMHQGIQELCK